MARGRRRLPPRPHPRRHVQGPAGPDGGDLRLSRRRRGGRGPGAGRDAHPRRRSAGLARRGQVPRRSGLRGAVGQLGRPRPVGGPLQRHAGRRARRSEHRLGRRRPVAVQRAGLRLAPARAAAVRRAARAPEEQQLVPAHAGLPPRADVSRAPARGRSGTARRARLLDGRQPHDVRGRHRRPREGGRARGGGPGLALGAARLRGRAGSAPGSGAGECRPVSADALLRELRPADPLPGAAPQRHQRLPRLDGRRLPDQRADPRPAAAVRVDAARQPSAVPRGRRRDAPVVRPLPPGRTRAPRHAAGRTDAPCHRRRATARRAARRPLARRPLRHLLRRRSRSPEPVLAERRRPTHDRRLRGRPAAGVDRPTAVRLRQRVSHAAGAGVDEGPAGPRRSRAGGLPQQRTAVRHGGRPGGRRRSPGARGRAADHRLFAGLARLVPAQRGQPAPLAELDPQAHRPGLAGAGRGGVGAHADGAADQPSHRRAGRKRVAQRPRPPPQLHLHAGDPRRPRPADAAADPGRLRAGRRGGSAAGIMGGDRPARHLRRPRR